MDPIRSEPETDEPFDYRTVTPEWIQAAGDAGIAAADEHLSEACLAATSADATFDEVVGRIDRAEGDLWTLGGRTGFMVRVHPDADVRAAGQAVEDRLNAWRQGLALRADIARAIRTYAESSDAAALSGEPRRLLDLWLRDLRRAGHGLPDSQRAEIAAITARLVVVESSFERNVTEWSDGIDLRREDLDGLSDAYIDRLGPGAESGTLRVSLDYPDYYPFMEGSRRRDLRRMLATKMANRAVEANRPILDEALTLRRRKAALLGYPSWAHFRIEPKMAGTPERVAAFHGAIFPAIQTLALDEYAAMRERLERDTGETDLAPWDIAYYDQRIRTEEYGVDPQEVSAYLPLLATIDGLLELTGDVFGLDYRRVQDARAWVDEVPLYEVRDRISAEHLGWFYLDLHPRPNKFGHAMAWPIRLARRSADGRRLGGISAIVANVPRAADDDPGLLRHDDVVMLYHEFGHVLHEVLGANATHRLSMWGVELDFPEAISQIMENWAWSPDILARVTRHHATGQPMPTDLAERLGATRSVDIGSEYLRSFGSYGDFDLRVHGPEPVDLDEAKVAADAVRLLPSIPDSFWPAAFAHIVADYDAGYYGYLWSLVYGDDLWSRFEAEGIASPVVGAAYRRELLEPGATRDAEAMVAAFLGRPSTNEAFLSRTGIALTPIDALTRSRNNMQFGFTLKPEHDVERTLGLTRQAEAGGFDYGWLFDSHVLWRDPYPLLTLMAGATERMRLGTCVTNPATREPSVTASTLAVLDELSGGRMDLGIGRGDSARRVLGKPPTTMASLEEAIVVIRDLVEGRTVAFEGTDLHLGWSGRWKLPVWVAGYGPMALAMTGRVADGVILQLADPDLIRWFVGQVREAEVAAGRPAGSVRVQAAAPAHLGDLDACRARTRWFPALVGNHVVDLVNKYPREALPEALTGYITDRTGYDYQHHAEVGSSNAGFVGDEVTDRFCVLGSVDDHLAKLHELAAAGVDQFNIYLMNGDEEAILETYGREIVPVMRAVPADGS